MSIAKLTEEVKDTSQRLTVESTMHKLVSKRAFWLALSGGAFTALGFLGWYFKLQRYLDEEIAERVATARRKAAREKGREAFIGGASRTD